MAKSIILRFKAYSLLHKAGEVFKSYSLLLFIICIQLSCSKVKTELEESAYNFSLEFNTIELNEFETKLLPKLYKKDENGNVENVISIWSSSDTTIVKIKNDSLSAIKSGNTILYASYNGKKYELLVNVQPLKAISLKLLNTPLELVISRTLTFNFELKVENNKIVKNPLGISIKNPDKHVTIIGNKIVGAKSGKAKIIYAYQNLIDSIQLDIIAFEEIKNIDTFFLKKSLLGTIELPVIVINFFPTRDGIELDPSRHKSEIEFMKWIYSNVNSGGIVPNSMELAKNRVIDILKFNKFGIEQGSRFRNYSNVLSLPQVEVNVVKWFNFYEIGTKSYVGGNGGAPEPNYQEIFSKINLRQLVETNGVKEVWFSLFPLSEEYPQIKDGSVSREYLINIPESNMSSILTGDISNSTRLNSDLPTYNKSYVVYGFNAIRGGAEALHNRGHQIESQLSYLDNLSGYTIGNRIFYDKFVGANPTLNNRPISRCGMTHFPPNTSVDYDYNNKSLVESDIENWKPNGGVKKLINSNRWLNIKYDFPKTFNFSDIENQKDGHLKWLIFWMQSIPGINNGIQNGNSKISNWWDRFYNWDQSIQQNKRLIE